MQLHTLDEPRRAGLAEQRPIAPPVSWALAIIAGTLLAVLSVAQVSGRFALGPYDGGPRQSWIYLTVYLVAAAIGLAVGGQLVERGRARTVLLIVVGAALLWFAAFVVFPSGTPMDHLAWTASLVGNSLASLAVGVTLIRSVAVVRSEQMAMALLSIAGLTLVIVRVPVEAGVHIVASRYDDRIAGLVLGLVLVVLGVLAWLVMGRRAFATDNRPMAPAGAQRWWPLVPVAGGLLGGGLGLVQLGVFITAENVVESNLLSKAGGLTGLVLVLVLGSFLSARRTAIALLAFLLVAGIAAAFAESVSSEAVAFAVHGCTAGLFVAGRVWVVASMGWDKIGRNLAVFVAASLVPHSLPTVFDQIGLGVSTRQMVFVGIFCALVGALCLIFAATDRSPVHEDRQSGLDGELANCGLGGTEPVQRV